MGARELNMNKGTASYTHRQETAASAGGPKGVPGIVDHLEYPKMMMMSSHCSPHSSSFPSPSFHNEHPTATFLLPSEGTAPLITSWTGSSAGISSNGKASPMSPNITEGLDGRLGQEVPLDDAVLAMEAKVHWTRDASCDRTGAAGGAGSTECWRASLGFLFGYLPEGPTSSTSSSSSSSS